MTDLATRRRELLDRQADLLGRLKGIDAELDSHNAQDWEDLATEREADEVLEGIGVSGQLELRMIEAALKRMDEGEYGFCVKCGAEIEKERLDAVPYTPHCRNCAT